MAPGKYVGVDGCKRGWFSVGFDSEGMYEFKVAKTFDKLLKHYKDADLILIDIPIGLPEGKCGRRCDGEAWVRMGSRGLSVFPTPTRKTVYQAEKSPKDYSAAAKVERDTSGKGLSRQSFSIAAKIAEVDKTLLDVDLCLTRKVREVHPEICFRAMNKGCPMEFGKTGKKKEEAKGERLRVLKDIELRYKKIFDEACSAFSAKTGIRDDVRVEVREDDILDALAAAVTAYYGYDQLDKLPVNDNQKDSKGLPMEMVFSKLG